MPGLPHLCWSIGDCVTTIHSVLDLPWDHLVESADIDNGGHIRPREKHGGSSASYGQG